MYSMKRSLQYLAVIRANQLDQRSKNAEKKCLRANIGADATENRPKCLFSTMQAVFEQLVAQLQNVVYVLLRIHILRLCNVSVTRSERDLK